LNDDINTKRTELANQMAAAGAAALDFNATACVLAAIPDTEPQQYAAAGTPEDIAKILPATICPQRRQKRGERPTEPLQWEDSAALPADLQQLKALALAYEYENNGVWYSIHQLADGITYEPAANFVAAANPAAVLDLFARIERAAAPTDAEVVVNGQIARRESIAANHDAMIILTQSYPREAVIRVVDAHTERNVAAALASQRAASPVSGDPHGTWAEVMKRVGPALKSGNLPTFERYSSDGFGGSALDSKGRFYLATDVDAELARSAAVSASQAAPTVEPIYQVRYETEKDSSAWHDATEDAYHTFVPERRRIVYAAPLARKAPEGLAMLCDQLLDIWDDGRRNAPEDRAYSEGALDEVIEEIRESFAAPVASQAAPVVNAMSKGEIDEIVYQCRQSGADTTYDIVNAALAQRAAVAAAKVPTGELSRRAVFAICDAYESGMGHGLKRDSHKSGEIFGNPDCGKAYEIGYAAGEERAAPVGAGVVPEGWPTPEMLKAGRIADEAGCELEGIFKDMLRAAPPAATAHPVAADDQVMTAAARAVMAERRRQVEQEVWTPEHDDQYDGGELSLAASCYALAGDGPHATVPEDWPWGYDWWKPRDDRANLVKAGALILADIERLDRATQQASAQKGGA